jgi:hypothetical protein
MNRARLRFCAAAVAAASLAGCAGGLAGPNAGVAALPQTVTRAATGDLLYVSDTETSDVYVYSYPDGKRKQRLTGFTDPGGECADSAGDVFVTNTGGSDVLEYAHGASKAKATLSDPGYFPIGCAVDPVSGNLAVTNFSKTSSSGGGDVVVYAHAKGSIAGRYRDDKIPGMLLCAYDDHGDLFVDGDASGSSFAFAELPQGKSTFTNVTLDQSIEMPGGVQWDGKYVVVGDQAANEIYRFSVSGTKGKEAGSTALTGGSAIFGFWIDGSKVIGPNSGSGSVGIWNYPAGGSPTKTITGLYVPLGATVSKG